jgi:hypothetical protein
MIQRVAVIGAGNIGASCRGGAASPHLSAPSSPQTRDFPSVCASSSTPWRSGSPLSKRWRPAPGFHDRVRLSRPRLLRRRDQAHAVDSIAPPSWFA